MNKAKVFAAIDRVLPEIKDIRHRVHRYPELAGEERETAKLIRERLKAAGISPLPPFLETDVVALTRGANPGKNITLRADIDALPLQEKTGLPYKSERDGLMHACGHDGHTATLLGAALVLNEFKQEFNGSVRFVFQPGEERAAMGKDLVAAGALLDPTPDVAIALHDRPGLPVGHIASIVGYGWAASDFFLIRVQGKGGHGAKPEATIDPIVVASQIVMALQTIVSRQVSAFDQAVVSVCRVQAGFNGNVIPDTAEIEGTARWFKDDVGKNIRESVERIVTHLCAAAGAGCEVEYQTRYIPLYNREEVVKRFQAVTKKYLGEDAWIDHDEPSMGGEDFAYYIQDYPGALFSLGIGDTASLHNPKFDFNDDALRSGIAFMVFSALEFLST